MGLAHPRCLPRSSLACHAQQQQEAPRFDLPLAVGLAGAAFEAYLEPLGGAGFEDMALNGSRTVFMDRHAVNVWMDVWMAVCSTQPGGARAQTGQRFHGINVKRGSQRGRLDGSVDGWSDGAMGVTVWAISQPLRRQTPTFTNGIGGNNKLLGGKGQGVASGVVHRAGIGLLPCQETQGLPSATSSALTVTTSSCCSS